MGIGEAFEFEKTGRIDPEPSLSLIDMALLPYTLTTAEAVALDEVLRSGEAKRKDNKIIEE